MSRKTPNSGDAKDVIVEFLSSDDAWYSVRLALYGPSLTVKYCDLPTIYDETFEPDQFKTAEELFDFSERFRPLSVQLQDSECRRLFKGVMVCASLVFRDGDVRFYDACIEEVDYKEHTFSNGEEECLCRFLLFWQNGPKVGLLTLSTVEHICLIKACAQVDPRLAIFLKMSRDRLKSISSNVDLISEDNGFNDGVNVKEIFRSHFKHKCRPKEAKCAKQSKRTTQATEGCKGFIVREWIEEDEDLGGEALLTKNLNESGNKHILVIENMEKDLSQSSVVEFIQEQSDIETEAFVFPSLPSDAYARGYVVVDCKEKLEKLLAFMDSPDHLIVSSRGRPWIVSGKVLMSDTFGWSSIDIPNSQSKGPRGKIRKRDELRVVQLGSEEYTRATKVKFSFTEFSDHAKRLHEMLESEMKEILDDSS